MSNSRSKPTPKLHHSLTQQRVVTAAEDVMFGISNDGFCTNCGERRGGCEPDARNYECPNCLEPKVFGAPEMVMLGLYHS